MRGWLHTLAQEHDLAAQAYDQAAQAFAAAGHPDMQAEALRSAAAARAATPT